MHDFFEWLTRSSADPANTSLMVKGLFTALAPILMVIFKIPSHDLDIVANGVEQVVFLGLSLLAASITLYGALRKVQLGRWAAPRD